jgi:glycosyltransferase involved in cell wall biosynthesis
MERSGLKMPSPSAESPIGILEILGNCVVGGMEKHVQRIVERLPSDKFRTIFVCPYESPFTRELRASHFPVFITPIRDDPTWQAIQVVTQIVNTQHIDVIHAHLPSAHVLGGIAGKFTGVPVVATIHGMNITALDFQVHKMIGSHLITVCQAAYAEALAMGAAFGLVTLIRNGVDTARFNADKRSANFRREINISDGAPVIGFIGRFAREKGPELFVATAEIVARKDRNVHFVMIGDGPLFGKISEMIDSSPNRARWHLLGVRRAMEDVYAAIDIVVLSSRQEGAPLVLLEAMAAERAVVATDVGGVSEIVEAGTTGLVAMPGDYDALADSCLVLLADRERRRRMGRLARQRVLEQFSLDTTVQQTVALLKTLGKVEIPSDPGDARNGASSPPITKQQPAPIKSDIT